MKRLKYQYILYYIHIFVFLKISFWTSIMVLGKRYNLTMPGVTLRCTYLVFPV